ncbi:glycosyl hydrolase family 17 protein [Carex rostrata]
MAAADQVLVRCACLHLILFVCFFFPIGSSFFFGGRGIGINYGRLGTNLPPPDLAVKLITSSNIKHVKTFDMDPLLIQAFSNTNITLSLCIPDQELPLLATDPTRADLILQRSILPFIHHTKILSISVGNEVSMVPDLAPHLLPAIKNVYKSLKRFKIHKKIKVTTTHSVAVLAIRSPPSNGIFQDGIAGPIMKPILQFLNKTQSPFMVNLYPYLTYKETNEIPLDFALFTENPSLFYTDPNTGLVYRNLFDILVDALNTAAASLGFHDLTLVVTETGWPTNGYENDNAASLDNARLFNQRLIKHVMRVPVAGTPMRPGVPVMVYLFALFDEDLKVGEPTENHWGLFYANGSKKYELGIEKKGGVKRTELVKAQNGFYQM